MWRCTGSAKRSRTERTRNGSSKGRRCRSCSAPSLVSIITPSDARTRFGSAQTVKSSRLSNSRASSCDVTSQPPSAGTHETGSKSRRRSSALTRLSRSRSANSMAPPIGKRALRAALSASSTTTCGISSPIRAMLLRGACRDISRERLDAAPRGESPSAERPSKYLLRGPRPACPPDSSTEARPLPAGLALSALAARSISGDGARARDVGRPRRR